LLANEFIRRRRHPSTDARFNPHSPLLANEFHAATSSKALEPCFNPHSPLLANELANTGRWWGRMSLFQSTFAIAGE